MIRILLKFSVLFSLFLVSCGQSEFEGYERTESGLLYKFHVRGTDTLKPIQGDVVTVRLTKRLGDSILETTEGAFPNGVDQLLGQPLFKGSLEEGFSMLVINDSVTFLIPVDSVKKFYPDVDSLNKIPAGKYYSFDIRLTNIKSRELVLWEAQQKLKQYTDERHEREQKEMAQFIADNHIATKPTASGLYLTVITQGKGPYPKDGDSVVVHYTGTFLNGTVFDSSTRDGRPFGFTMGTKKVIEGWEQGIKMMRQGTKASLLIPSSLAWDSAGVQDSRTGKFFIPPYAPVLFDIQLIDINPKSK